MNPNDEQITLYVLLTIALAALFIRGCWHFYNKYVEEECCPICKTRLETKAKSSHVIQRGIKTIKIATCPKCKVTFRRTDMNWTARKKILLGAWERK